MLDILGRISYVVLLTIADEVTDKEQFAIVIRLVDNVFFLIYMKTLLNLLMCLRQMLNLKQILLKDRHQIQLAHHHEQAYDGAANMSSRINGVSY